MLIFGYECPLTCMSLQYYSASLYFHSPVHVFVLTSEYSTGTEVQYSQYYVYQYCTGKNDSYIPYNLKLSF